MSTRRKEELELLRNIDVSIHLDAECYKPGAKISGRVDVKLKKKAFVQSIIVKCEGQATT